MIQRRFSRGELGEMGVPHDMAQPYANKDPEQAVVYRHIVDHQSTISTTYNIVFRSPDDGNIYEIFFRDVHTDPRVDSEETITGRQVVGYWKLTPEWVGAENADYVPPVVPLECLKSALEEVIPPGEHSEEECSRMAEKISPRLEEEISAHKEYEMECLERRDLIEVSP